MFVLGQAIRLLHPIMPFVTDELYHQMGFATADDSIMKTEWPAAISEDVLNGYGATQAAEDDAEAKFELIRAIRAVRANYGIATSKALDMVVSPANDEMHEFLKRDEASFKALVNAGELKFVPGYQPEGPSGVAVSCPSPKMGQRALPSCWIRSRVPSLHQMPRVRSINTALLELKIIFLRRDS